MLAQDPVAHKVRPGLNKTTERLHPRRHSRRLLAHFFVKLSLSVRATASAHVKLPVLPATFQPAAAKWRTSSTELVLTSCNFGVGAAKVHVAHHSYITHKPHAGNE